MSIADLKLKLKKNVNKIIKLVFPNLIINTYEKATLPT